MSETVPFFAHVDSRFVKSANVTHKMFSYKNHNSVWKNADCYANLNSLRWVKKKVPKKVIGKKMKKSAKSKNLHIRTSTVQYFANNFYLGHFLKSILANLESA
jgi:hypothetical protein